MIKKIAFAGVGFALLASPFFVSAQTVAASANTSLLATLEALVQQLEQELQQLIAAKSSAGAAACIVGVNCQNLNSGAGPNISQCTAYANLQKGDTDATTGGEVSKLQAFLGINPATGYYGALTSIGYTNKCIGGNSQPTSVLGMSEYTDTNFGFSFWYPSSWSVTQAATVGGSLTTAPAKRLLVSAPGNQMGFDVFEVSAPNGIVVASDNCTETYSFSSSAGQWMQTQSGCDSPTTTQAANVSANTMGGLHEFNAGGNVQGTTGTVLPLSATSFVDVETFGDENYGSQKYLADTILATNANVATPLSTAQQTATIQAEANAYGVTASNSSNNSVSFTESPATGSAPLAVTFNANPVPSGSSINFGDGTIEQTNNLFGNGISNSAGYCGAGPNFFCSVPHTYASAGTYAATLKNSSGVVIGTQTIIVTGSSATSQQTYTNSQYGFSFQYPSNFAIQTNTALLQDGMGPDTTLAQVTYPSTSSTDKGILEAVVDSYAPDVASCLVAPASTEVVTTNVGTKTFNGVSFFTYERDDAFAGGFDTTYVYKTVKNATCFQMSYTAIHSGGVTGTNEGQIQAQMKSSLDLIVQSFRFTQ
jgi:hypothetical protein